MLSAFAETPQITTTTAISVFLVNERGEETTGLGVPKGKGVKDILFKYVLKEDAKNFTSWAFEVTDPDHNLSYRMAFEGKLPPLLHWDGIFNAKDSIAVNHKYFMRLLLITRDNKVLASPWAFFNTKVKPLVTGPRTSGNLISLYITPTGGLYGLYLRTKNYETAAFPTLYGDVRLVWKDIHTFGLRLEATSNVLFGYAETASGFFYSDISLFYRYRLMGAPIRAPLVPVFPAYADARARNVEFRLERFAKPQNAEVGVRIFNSLLRGYDGAPIDPELSRFVQGLAITGHYDRALGAFRFHGGVEAGYTVFRGRLVLGSAEVGFTYERVASLSPGLQIRYQILTGSPAGDQFNASEQVTDQMLFGGFILYFKI